MISRVPTEIRSEVERIQEAIKQKHKMNFYVLTLSMVV